MLNSNTNNSETSTFRSLEDIRLRKAQLLTEITKDSNKVEGMWNNLFHQPKANKLAPTSRFSGMMKTGAGLLDVAILGWKLYRKFNSGKSKTSKKKKFGLF